MAIDFKQFAQSKPATSASAKEARPSAKYWLNIGYAVEVQTDAGTESRFISLPVGIPVDTMEPVSTKSSNDEYRALQAARNDLLDQIMAAAGEVKAGEEVTLNLEIRLRKVNDEQAVIPAADNPFIRKVL